MRELVAVVDTWLVVGDVGGASSVGMMVVVSILVAFAGVVALMVEMKLCWGGERTGFVGI